MDPRCPCCNLDEDTEHIYQSDSDIQTKVFLNEIDSLNNYLLNVTAWEIRSAIAELTTAFREQRAPNIHHNWSDKVESMVMEQYALGQRAFLSGMWIKDWSEEQEKHHKMLKTKKHDSTVIVSIIQRVQKIIGELWFSRNDALHQNNKSRAIVEKLRTSIC